MWTTCCIRLGRNICGRFVAPLWIESHPMHFYSVFKVMANSNTNYAKDTSNRIVLHVLDFVRCTLIEWNKPSTWALLPDSPAIGTSYQTTHDYLLKLMAIRILDLNDSTFNTCVNLLESSQASILLRFSSYFAVAGFIYQSHSASKITIIYSISN